MKLVTRRMASRLKPTRSLRAIPGLTVPFGPRPLTTRPPLMGGMQPPRIYGRLGNMDVRLARSRGDVRRAQKLRYHIFYEEMSAIPTALSLMSRRDEDPYDAICDHLLVVDNGDVPRDRRRWPRRARVVGTYRMLRQDVAEMHDGFYTQGEYDIAPLIAAKPGVRFMEVGRSCVMKSYRNRRTVELLWQGLWGCVQEHKVDVLVGCASFAGTDPRQHAQALSFLHHFARAPEEWHARAHDHRYIDMNMIPADEIDTRKAMRLLPPLIKGYLRLGAYFGEGAVIDPQFGTTDVLIVLPMANMEDRYVSHFIAHELPENAILGAGQSGGVN